MIGIKSCVKNLINDIYSNSRKFDMVARKGSTLTILSTHLPTLSKCLFYQIRICNFHHFHSNLYHICKEMKFFLHNLEFAINTQNQKPAKIFIFIRTENSLIIIRKMENELFLITIIALMIKILMRKYKSGKG
jgi:hypothetical protein